MADRQHSGNTEADSVSCDSAYGSVRLAIGPAGSWTYRFLAAADAVGDREFSDDARLLIVALMQVALMQLSWRHAEPLRGKKD
jgi:hypothetical protein